MSIKPHLDPPGSCPNHEQRVSDVHRIDALWHLLRVHRVGLPQVPVLDSPVPAAGDEHVIQLLDKEGVCDGRIMLSHDLRLVGCERPHLDLLVAPACMVDFNTAQGGDSA